MTNQDTLLVGLSGQDKNDSLEPQSQDTGQDDTAVDTADRLMRRLNGEGPAEQPDPGPEPQILDSTIVPAQSSSSEVPAGAVTAPGGIPFTDFDSASYKAQQMSAQTGDEFLVVALSASEFVVIGRLPSGKTAAGPDQNDDEEEAPSSYRDIPIKKLKIEDFPEKHPVHKCGLARYKKYMKNGFKFKPAYRSMWPLLFVAALGGFVYLFPVIAISQLPQDMINTILESISPEQFTMGVAYFGAALGAFALGKVLIQRHIHRYMLLDGFAKYEYGIIARESTKIAYTNISNYEVKQSFIGRVLNYGDMELASPGTGDSEIKMTSVLAPRLVEVVLEGRINDAESGRHRSRR